jgi:hypothetical protein
MSPRMKRTAALAGGAAVLAFGAYTVGSQAGNGVAQSQGAGAGAPGFVVAYGGPPGGPPPPPGGPPGRGLRFRGGPPPDLAALAKQLGVKESDLRAALQKVRGSQQPPNPGDMRDELATKLADKLNVDKADVQKALDEIQKEDEAEHQKRRDAFAEALAKELGISADKVKGALPDEPPHHGRRGP